MRRSNRHSNGTTPNLPVSSKIPRYKAAFATLRKGAIARHWLGGRFKELMDVLSVIGSRSGHHHEHRDHDGQTNQGAGHKIES
jgi:hypothetical protein